MTRVGKEAEELIVPFTIDPLEMAKLRKRERRQERREARKQGISTDQYRKQKAVLEGPPDPKAPQPVRVARVPLVVPKDAYREQILEHLELPLCADPEEHHWLGFSLDELQLECPDPKKGAEKVIERVAQYAPLVALDKVVVFRDRLIGVGPWR